MKNKEKRSFTCIVSVGFCLTEVITPSLFLAFLALERNYGTLPDTENDNSFTHIVPNYNNQELFSYNTIICGLLLYENRVRYKWSDWKGVHIEWS